MAPTRGAFIVLEGLDRSGKTTQVELLEKRLKEGGREVKRMRFPDRSTPIGQMIDGYLKSDVQLEDHVIHLLFSANRWEAVGKINSLLESGTTIVSDRYYHSGVVYSAAKHNPSLPLSWARSPEKGLPRPDLVLFLDLDEETARARGGWGEEVYEQPEMQRRVRQLFRALSAADQGAAEAAQELEGLGEDVRRREREDLVVVNAGGSVEDVSERIWAQAKGRVAQVESGQAGDRVRTVE